MIGAINVISVRCACVCVHTGSFCCHTISCGRTTSQANTICRDIRHSQQSEMKTFYVHIAVIVVVVVACHRHYVFVLDLDVFFFSRVFVLSCGCTIKHFRSMSPNAESTVFSLSFPSYVIFLFFFFCLILRFADNVFRFHLRSFV